MKLFGKNIKTNNSSELQITSADREWVEANFLWLVKVFGHLREDQISVSEATFPNTFSTKEIKIENLIMDCCNHLELDRHIFSFKIYEDIRDSTNMPYVIEGSLVDCDLFFDEQTGKYLLSLAKSLFNYPYRLIFSVCYEFTKAKLIQSQVKYDTGADTNQFLYCAAVYFGYGLVISHKLIDIGSRMDGIYRTTWSFKAEISQPIFAYSLAIFAKLKNDLNPIWKAQLPKELRIEFDLSIQYISKSKNELFDALCIDNALNAHKLYRFAGKQYQMGEINKAIRTLQRIIFVTEDLSLKSLVYNNIGYYMFKLLQYERSIPYFQKALKLNPNHGYANDNIGFAYIMTDDLEIGKEYLDRAIKTNNNDNAYSFRNLAVYYQKKGDAELAETFFQKAFDCHTPVDLLDYFYGKFLIDKGENENGLEHIQVSADLGEREGIELLEELKTKHTS